MDKRHLRNPACRGHVTGLINTSIGEIGEIDELIDEGRTEEMHKYERIEGFLGLVLDQAGYDVVVNKKEWVHSVEEPVGTVEM